MGLRRRQEREVVATVGDGSGDECYDKPQPASSQVRAHQQWSHKRRKHVTDNVLHRVSVHARYSNRCRPLMVLLVDVLIKAGVMEQPEMGQPEKSRVRFY